MKNLIQINCDIINCSECKLHTLKINDNSRSDIGYGKILGKKNEKTDIVVVGLNPSRNRFKGLKYAFCGGEYFKQDKSGYAFLEILKRFEIFNRSYITNLAKCSTINNKISDEELEKCYEKHFLEEVECCKPMLILCVGNQVHQFLKSRKELLKYKIDTINHPSYCFSYQRITLEKYVEQIKNVLVENNIV